MPNRAKREKKFNENKRASIEWKRRERKREVHTRSNAHTHTLHVIVRMENNYVRMENVSCISFCMVCTVAHKDIIILALADNFSLLLPFLLLARFITIILVVGLLLLQVNLSCMEYKIIC